MTPTTGSCPPRQCRWRNTRQLAGQAIPAPLKGWLLDRGSLTERLVARSAGKFHVNVLCQHWAVPRIDEAQLLQLGGRQRSLVREVLLHGNGVPWVYARSILPARSLDGHLRYLKRIGNKPLGAILFSDPCMQRGPIEIARLMPGQIPIDVSTPVWGRRSVFYLQHQPLLVSEVFLPGFET